LNAIQALSQLAIAGCASWKIIKREEFDRLTLAAPENKKYQPEIERRERQGREAAREIEAQLEKLNPIKVNQGFDARRRFKN
jgi:hypothetical protein